MFESRLKTRLAQQKQNNLYRYRQANDNNHVDFSSNDYLGLASEPKVIKAFASAIEQYGVGARASQLVTGHHLSHQALEEELADFLQYPRVLLFSTGYMANLAVLTTLLEAQDQVLLDKLCHASLIDGALFSKAKLQRYLHLDCDDLNKRLSQHPNARQLIVTDSIFSMDGDIAPLADLAKIAKEHHAWLMADDAHAIGVLGKQGRGSIEYHNLTYQDVPILVGTFGKSFGCFGAFVAASDRVIETMIQFARPYIYTTAPPPAVAEACRASLKIIREEPWRREYLNELIRYFRKCVKQLGLKVCDSITAIQPVLMGDTKKAMRLSRKLKEQGFMVTAMRPPTVPKGTDRLRVTLTVNHTKAQIDKLLEIIANASFQKI